jgi:hypothetical protein
MAKRRIDGALAAEADLIGVHLSFRIEDRAGRSEKAAVQAGM